MGGFFFCGVSSALPTIGVSLGATSHLSWVVAANLLTATAMTPLYGKISDIYGRRLSLTVGIWLFLLGALIGAPGRGERPLWDFPPDLYKRELAASGVRVPGGFATTAEAFRDFLEHAIDGGASLAGGRAGVLVTLYLLFFFMRDGAGLIYRLRDAIPLAPDVKQNLAGKFAKDRYTVSIITRKEGEDTAKAFFDAIANERGMMYLVLGFISVVAAFCIMNTMITMATKHTTTSSSSSLKN